MHTSMRIHSLGLGVARIESAADLLAYPASCLLRTSALESQPGFTFFPSLKLRVLSLSLPPLPSLLLDKCLRFSSRVLLVAWVSNSPNRFSPIRLKTKLSPLPGTPPPPPVCRPSSRRTLDVSTSSRSTSPALRASRSLHLVHLKWLTVGSLYETGLADQVLSIERNRLCRQAPLRRARHRRPHQQRRCPDRWIQERRQIVARRTRRRPSHEPPWHNRRRVRVATPPPPGIAQEGSHHWIHRWFARWAVFDVPHRRGL